MENSVCKFNWFFFNRSFNPNILWLKWCNTNHIHYWCKREWKFPNRFSTKLMHSFFFECVAISMHNDWHHMDPNDFHIDLCILKPFNCQYKLANVALSQWQSFGRGKYSIEKYSVVEADKFNSFRKQISFEARICKICFA